MLQRVGWQGKCELLAVHMTDSSPACGWGASGCVPGESAGRWEEDDQAHAPQDPAGLQYDGPRNMTLDGRPCAVGVHCRNRDPVRDSPWCWMAPDRRECRAVQGMM